MIVETLAVGTELLLGQIANTNAREIATRLAESGLTHLNQAVVGDNATRMEAAIRAAADRCDALIITGGIGPTADDITREAVAAVAGVPLVYDRAYEQALRERWARMRPDLDFPESNLRQAYRPDGAGILANRKGTAPGFHIRVDRCWIFAVPGVPAEMLAMVDEGVLPLLREEEGGGRVVVSRLLRSWGMAEAKVGEELQDLFDASENPSIAFLASAGEIKIRITALARSDEEARALIAPVEAEVRRRIGDRIFGADDDTIERVIRTELESRGWTIGTAESATGGLVGRRLTSLPGASGTFRGSVVAYASDLKASILGVPAETITQHGVVSEETAQAMVQGARSVLGVDVAVAVTGSAGPEPLEQPVGTMIVAVATPHRATVNTLHLPGDREQVRSYAATAALHLVRRAILES
ncbi:MAG: competence/damage-inducible protein A [Actinomycetota bacterium]|nr:competence/damage-inducible protein A [Actinomycetota bacterium]